MALKTSLPLAAALALAAGAAAAGPLPEFQIGPVSVALKGRVYADAVSLDAEPAAGPDFGLDETRLRLARLGAEGGWGERWTYKAELSLLDEEYEWTDVYLRRKVGDRSRIQIGNFRTISLESLTSDRDTTFMERGPYADVIDTGRTATVGVKTGGRAWTAAAWLSGASINDAVFSGHDSTAVSARFTWAPIAGETEHLHLGAWVRRRDLEDGSPFRYRVRNNVAVGPRYTDSGSSLYGTGRADTALGLEGAWIDGPFSVQGEVARIRVDRRAGEAVDVDAGYVFASWFLTGERRAYKPADGEMGRPRILRPVGARGAGAWEAAVRFDRVDLSEFRGAGGVPIAAAGTYEAVTAGLSWYANSLVRMSANLTTADNDAGLPASDARVDVAQVRIQFDF